MALDDYLESEVAIAVAATAAIASPKVRGVLRQGAVYSVAAVLMAGDALGAFARGMGRGAQQATTAAAGAATATAQTVTNAATGDADTTADAAEAPPTEEAAALGAAPQETETETPRRSRRPREERSGE